MFRLSGIFAIEGKFCYFLAGRNDLVEIYLVPLKTETELLCYCLRCRRKNQVPLTHIFRPYDIFVT